MGWQVGGMDALGRRVCGQVRAAIDGRPRPDQAVWLAGDENLGRRAQSVRRDVERPETCSSEAKVTVADAAPARRSGVIPPRRSAGPKVAL